MLSGRNGIIFLCFMLLVFSTEAYAVTTKSEQAELIERATEYYNQFWLGEKLDELQWRTQKLRNPELIMNVWGGFSAMQEAALFKAESRNGLSDVKVKFVREERGAILLKVTLTFNDKSVIVLEGAEYWAKEQEKWKLTLPSEAPPTSANASTKPEQNEEMDSYDRWLIVFQKLLSESEPIRAERLLLSESNRTSVPEMQYIKGGCFKMGDVFHGNPRRYGNYRAHKVCLDDFYMDSFEVTNEEFQKFKPGFPGSTISLSSLVLANKENEYPAVNLDWADADQFCKSRGKRLPTEAEWEYAARGGVRNKLYWKKLSLTCSYANISDDTYRGADEIYADDGFPCNDGFAGAAPGGSFPPNPYGLYDMIGNVSEWVNDWEDEDYYSHSPVDNPQGPKSGEYKILRGGAYGSTPRGLAVFGRSGGVVDRRTPARGFRCAKDANQP